MKLPLALLVALTASMSGREFAGGVTLAQNQRDPDGVRSLLQRIERIVSAGDIQAYAALLSDTADRSRVRDFGSTELLSGATRVVVRERDRGPLTGTLPGNGYQVVVSVFTEFGARARTATWRLDLKRVGEGSDEEWRIADQQRISLVEGLYRLSLNPAKQFDARNLTIAAEDLDLTLAEGSAFVTEVDDGITGLVLIGRGELSFHPAPEVEKGQLKIFCGADALLSRFDAAFIRVSPGELAKFIGMDRLTPRAVNAREFRRASDVFRDEVSKSYGLDMTDFSRDLWSLLPASGDFLAEIRTRRFDTLTYTHSSSEAEDLALFDRKRHRNIAVYTSQERLTRRGRSYNEDELTTYDVLDYDINMAVSPDRLWLDGRARLQVKVRAPGINSLTLRLAEPLVVQSIVSDQLGRLFGVRVRNQNSIIINLPSVVLRDDELALTIVYAGRLEPQTEDPEALSLAQTQRPPGSSQEEMPAIQTERSLLYSNRSYWYPQGNVTDYATARVRVSVPSGFECVASGELAAGYPMTVAGTDGGQARKLYLFAADVPLRYLAFIVSRFVRSDALPVAFGAGKTGLNLVVQANPRLVARGHELAARAADIVSFYESIVGDSPYPSLTLALVEKDLPGGHSPGYVAVLNQPLPTSPYTWRNDPASFEDYPEFFVAHEIAHQWWGQAVGWRNYHEQWLSEGFAQYFAALYAQHRRGDETFTSVLRQLRKFGMQQSDQGPISLGYRLGHIKADSRIFRAVVYDKSAAVLHMLRRLVGDEAFFRGVRRFYFDSLFRKAGTDDFRAAMEAETGRPLERFFEQWIYGSTLPRVKLAYTVEAGSVVIRVEQVGELFDVPVTVTLQYADKREVDVVVPVTERTTDMRVALTGTLRGVDISKDDGTLVDVVKN